MKKLLRLFLPVLILGGGILFIVYLNLTKPVTERRKPPEPIVQVDAVRLQPETYTITIRSQGSVRARTESTLIPEVSGRILSISSNFREGGFFSKGDILLEIDSSDYLTALTVAEANLAEARVRMAEEEAQSGQARRDWERLGSGETPSDLVLRSPQLALARANVAAAEARVQQARRDLDRTRVSAPYDGRVLTKRVDVGQVVSPGNLLAEIYAVDYAEIRLPLTTDQYAMLDMAPVARGAEQDEQVDIPVRLFAQFGQETISWTGRITRVEGAIDTRNRQVYVVAQVDDPYGSVHSRPLKVGLFVEAEIGGKTLEDVFVLPRTALRESKFVLTIDSEKRLKRVPVTPLWADSEEIIFFEESIAPGTLVSLTQMALAIDGMHVQPSVVTDESGPAEMEIDPETLASKSPVPSP
ncbi:efflux RND transporter periplasmic adaptor subunit [Puniceicoccales bacterium CK1056]|uniref:Efflux RND transporter periplasmic adaptor subunit n=1 Tax=Oceanipulchritudo coccoides TaxID=2706888 RepID=A0A6B2LXY7_9BACT|nr:efflux RND transporter periplasmic adaptor subunit [Oceanipulchritudo coccoides]NDV60906.1 efflux RND transporter periplasmic adaptor subunit [Oceanipulchritudo coccoides]